MPEAMPATPSNFRAAMAAKAAAGGNNTPAMTPEGGSGGGGGEPPAQQQQSQASQQRRAAPQRQQPQSEPQAFPEYEPSDEGGSLAPEVDPGNTPAMPDFDDTQFTEEAQAGEDEWNLDEDFHGMKLRDVMKAIFKDGLIPSALLEKLAAEYTIDGRPTRLGLHEYPNGFMRQSDYARRMGELRTLQVNAEAAKSRAEQYMNTQRDLFESWKKDPATARRDLRRLGLGNTVFAIAQQIANEMVEVEKLHPDARKLFLENKRMREAQEDEAYHAQIRQQQQQSLTQQQQSQQRQAEIHRALQTAVPRAFQRHGLDINSQLTADAFRAAFNNLWDGRNDTFAQAIEDAAVAAKEDVERYAHAHNQGGQQQQQSQQRQQSPAQQQVQQHQAPPMGTRRLPGAGGAPPAHRKGGTVGDFKKQFRSGKR